MNNFKKGKHVINEKIKMYKKEQTKKLTSVKRMKIMLRKQMGRDNFAPPGGALHNHIAHVQKLLCASTYLQVVRWEGPSVVRGWQRFRTLRHLCMQIQVLLIDDLSPL